MPGPKSGFLGGAESTHILEGTTCWESGAHSGIDSLFATISSCGIVSHTMTLINVIKISTLVLFFWACGKTFQVTVCSRDNCERIIHSRNWFALHTCYGLTRFEGAIQCGQHHLYKRCALTDRWQLIVLSQQQWLSYHTSSFYVRQQLPCREYT